MNWHNQGKSAALEGEEPQESLNYYNRECRVEHGVVPNSTDFTAGYNDGLKIFCTPEFSKKYGLNGKHYRVGTCPTEIENKVVDGYKDGRIKYLQDEVSTLCSTISTLESEKSSLESEVSSLKSNQQSCPAGL